MNESWRPLAKFAEWLLGLDPTETERRVRTYVRLTVGFVVGLLGAMGLLAVDAVTSMSRGAPLASFWLLLPVYAGFVAVWSVPFVAVSGTVYLRTIPDDLRRTFAACARFGGALTVGVVLSAVLACVFRLWRSPSQLLTVVLLVLTLSVGAYLGWFRISAWWRQLLAVKLVFVVIAVVLAVSFPELGELGEFAGARLRSAIYGVTRIEPQRWEPNSADEIKFAADLWYHRAEDGGYELYRSRGHRLGKPLTRATTPEEFQAIYEWQLARDREREEARRAVRELAVAHVRELLAESLRQLDAGHLSVARGHVESARRHLDKRRAELGADDFKSLSGEVDRVAGMVAEAEAARARSEKARAAAAGANARLAEAEALLGKGELAPAETKLRGVLRDLDAQRDILDAGERPGLERRATELLGRVEAARAESEKQERERQRRAVIDALEAQLVQARELVNRGDLDAAWRTATNVRADVARHRALLGSDELGAFERAASDLLNEIARIREDRRRTEEERKRAEAERARRERLAKPAAEVDEALRDVLELVAVEVTETPFEKPEIRIAFRNVSKRECRLQVRAAWLDAEGNVVAEDAPACFVIAAGRTGKYQTHTVAKGAKKPHLRLSPTE